MTDIIRRFLWAYVAFKAAWEAYPEKTTVLHNKDLSAVGIIPHSFD